MIQQIGLFNPPSSNRGGKPGKSSGAGFGGGNSRGDAGGSGDASPVQAKRLEVGIDWLAFTCPAKQSTEVLAVLMEFFECQVDAKRAVATRGYLSCTSYDDGFKMSWSDDRPEMHFQMSGSQLGRLNVGEQVALVRRLGSLCWRDGEGLNFKTCHWTRIDVRVDDYERRVSPTWMSSWAEAGYMTGFRKHGRIETFRGMDNAGKTFSAGSRGQNGAGKYYRCYDKFLESCGLINAIRHEAEFSSDYAAAVAERICCAQNPEDIFTTLRDVVLGSIDFRHGSKSLGLRDRPRIIEWHEFVSDVERFKFERPDKRVDAGFPKEFFLKAWANKLAQLAQRDGLLSLARFISDCIARGRENGFGVDIPIEKRLGSIGFTESEIDQFVQVLGNTRRRKPMFC